MPNKELEGSFENYSAIFDGLELFICLNRAKRKPARTSEIQRYARFVGTRGSLGTRGTRGSLGTRGLQGSLGTIGLRRSLGSLGLLSNHRI